MPTTKIIEITIPVLNEEATLEAQVLKSHRYFCSELTDLQPISLVIADNGSTDKTQEIAERLALENDSIQYVRLDERGVGLALKTSWGNSEADIVGYMDLDLATDLRYLRPALEPLLDDSIDVVTGSRLAKGATVNGRSLLRSFTSRVFNTIVKSYFRTGFSDGMCGFKFLQRKYLADIREKGADSDGWFFATELLVVAEYLKFRVKDLPVEWTDDPDSKVKISKLAVEYLKAMKTLNAKLKSSEV